MIAILSQFMAEYFVCRQNFWYAKYSVCYDTCGAFYGRSLNVTQTNSTIIVYLTKSRYSLERPTVVFGDSVLECHLRAGNAADRSIPAILHPPIDVP